MDIFTAIALIISVVSTIMQILAKPKARDQENTIQRQGLDQKLERLYGTRKMSMVVTDANSGRTGSAFWYEDEKLVGVSAKHKESDKFCSEPHGFDERPKGTWSEPRNTMMRIQGPLCVAGRKNAPFSQDYLSIEDFDVKVDGKDYNDRDLISRTKHWNGGTGWAVYLRGYIEDKTFKRNDAIGFTQMISAYGEAHLDLEKGKGKFAGIPEYEFTLRSNFLFDPRISGNDHFNPATWTGRRDNPVLQLLDYLLDDVFGAAMDYDNEIDEESFIQAANIADVQIGIVMEEEQAFAPYGYYGYAGNRSSRMFNIPGQWLTDWTNNPRTIKRSEAAPLLTSNITLNTGDTIAENTSALLAACRGARLFRNRLGRWTIRPAWLLDEDFKYTWYATGETTYNVPFLPDGPDQEPVVKVNDSVVSNYTIQLGGEDGVDNGNVISGFKEAVYEKEEERLTIHFNGTPPPYKTDVKYTIKGRSGRPGTVYQQSIGFDPAPSDMVTYQNTWRYEGPLDAPITGDLTLKASSGYSLREVAGSNDVKVGLVFDSPPSGKISIEYPMEAYGGLTTAAHIIRDPIDLDLDYDAIEDVDGIPLLRMSGTTNYKSVSSDDKYNKVTVKFADAFLDFKPSEVSYPDIEADPFVGVELRIEDNGKPLLHTVEVNHITNKAEAADYAEFLLRQSRSADSLDLTVDSLGMMLEPNDIVFVTDPQLKTNDPDTSEDRSKYWRVVSTRIQTNGTVQVALTRYEAEDFGYLSPLMLDRKYTPITSPIPQVIFPNSVIIGNETIDNPEIFEDASAGWGRLRWELPAGLDATFRYRVSVSRARVWDLAIDYEADEVVWYNRLKRHYRTRISVPATEGFAPEDGKLGNPWEALDEDEDTRQFELLVSDTDAMSIIIPNEADSRFYTYSVEATTALGRGQPAYITIDIQAALFGLQSILLLDSTKDIVVIPYTSDEVGGGTGSIDGGTYTGTRSGPELRAKEYDFSNSEYYLMLKKADEVVPLNVNDVGDYAGEIDEASTEGLNPNSWYIRQVIPRGIDLQVPEYSADPSTNLIFVDDIEAMQGDSLKGALDIIGIYVDDKLNKVPVLKTVQYVASSLGADGIDGNDGQTIVQLSVYRRTDETYNNDGTLDRPSTPVGGYYDFSTDILQPPRPFYFEDLVPPEGAPNEGSIAGPDGWGGVPPPATEGVIWVSSQLYVRKNMEELDNEPLGDWSTPSLFASFGGSYTTESLYARVIQTSVNDSTLPKKPEENDVMYDFSTGFMLRKDGSNITMQDPFIESIYEWYPGVPPGQGNVWVTQSQFSIPGKSGIDSRSVWTDPSTISGQGGKSIYNGYLLANRPRGGGFRDTFYGDLPDDDDIGYNFNLEQYEINDNPDVKMINYRTSSGVVWYDPQELPNVSGPNNQVYIIRETFTTLGGFGTDEESTWSEPTMFTGEQGADGLASYMAAAYILIPDGKAPGDIGAPPIPSGGSYNFDSGVLVPPTGWKAYIPEWQSPYDNLWVTQNLVTTNNPKEDVDITDAWSTATKMATNGIDGTSTEIIFKRSGNKPDPFDGNYVPSGSTGDDGWYNRVENVPDAAEGAIEPLWASNGRKLGGIQPDGTFNEWWWDTPYMVEGTIIAEVSLYRRVTYYDSYGPAADGYEPVGAEVPNSIQEPGSNGPAAPWPPGESTRPNGTTGGTDGLFNFKTMGWDTLPTSADQGNLGSSAWLPDIPNKFDYENIHKYVWVTKTVIGTYNADYLKEVDHDQWSWPTLVFTDGEKGEPGPAGTSVEIVWARQDLEPSKPVDGPDVPTGGPVWWDVVENIPADHNTDEQVWSSIGKRDGYGDWIWDKPLPAGSDGAPGQTAAEVTVYKRASTKPSKPVAGVYDFTIGQLSTNPNTWYQDISNVADTRDPLWVSKAAVVGTGQGFDMTGKWSDVARFAEDGKDGTPGVVVNISASTQVFEYTSNESIKPSTPDRTTITADPQNADGILQYKFYVDGSLQNTAGNSFIYIPQADGGYASLPSVVKVELIKDGSVIAIDQTTLVGIKEPKDGTNGNPGNPGVDGDDGITVVLTNEAHTVPANSAGAPTSYTGSGTDIYVYQGGSQLTAQSAATPTPSTFSVTASGQYISPGSKSNNGSFMRYNTASGFSSGQSLARINFNIRVVSAKGAIANVTKVQSFSKSIDGANGQNGQNGQNGSNGQDGATGPEGPKGDQGPQGPKGDQGPPGTDGGSATPEVVGAILTIFKTSPSVKPTKQEINALEIGYGNTGTGSGSAYADAVANGFSSYIQPNTWAITTRSFAGNNSDQQSYSWRWLGTDWQQAEIIDTDVIRADAIQADQLQVSSNASQTFGERMYFNGGQNRIEIYDSSNIMRVKLGKL